MLCITIALSRASDRAHCESKIFPKTLTHSALCPHVLLIELVTFSQCRIKESTTTLSVGSLDLCKLLYSKDVKSHSSGPDASGVRYAKT